MSVYVLQKLIRDVNRIPAKRDAYFATRETFVAEYSLTDEERAAVLAFDVHRLYALGVHGLLLRPYTIIHQMPEAAYLRAIRGETEPSGTEPVHQ
jgi:hypothetical protein